MFKLFKIAAAKSPFGYSLQVAAALIIGLGNVTSAYGESTVKKSEVVMVENVYEILDKDLIKISFAEDSSELSNQSLTALSDFAKATKGEAKIERYIVATWSDQNYPKTGEVSETQRKLAELRAVRIKDALGAAGAKKVDTFEMTKQPNWIQRVFSTETAEIKNKGMSSTANQRLLKEIGQKLRKNGGPHMAVVVAKFKNEVSTQ